MIFKPEEFFKKKFPLETKTEITKKEEEENVN
jgi:hypothetical protein